MVKINSNKKLKEIFRLKRKIKIILLLFILLLLYVYVASITLMPKSIILMQGESLNLATLWGISIKENEISNPNIGEYKQNRTVQAVTTSIEGNSTLEQAGKIELSVNLLDKIQLKDVSVNVVPKVKVVPLGNAIGLKLYTEGVLIVGMSEIEGKRPYEFSGIKEGDRIVAIDNKKIETTEDLIETVNASNGKEVFIKYVRENEEEQTSITPVKTKQDEYKLGLWVRDAAGGVGTASFYVPSTGMFASLGHGITDVDTGDLITISNGELVNTNIVSIKKGEKGNPGEIKGSIEGMEKIGEVYKNTSFGIFGKVSNKNNLKINAEEMEVLNRNEIKKGNAQIICELENGKKEYYDIEIQKIYTANNKDNKSMLIKITDERLLEKTGGIIQGMSGSPIIQNGKFVGAVTHVLVNDPTAGYGVFADIMIQQLRK